MSVKVINGQAIPNMPWQDKPADCNEVIWRDNRNPIIPRNLLPTSNSIFNSAVVPFEGKFAGVFRVDDKERNMAPMLVSLRTVFTGTSTQQELCSSRLKSLQKK